MAITNLTNIAYTFQPVVSSIELPSGSKYYIKDSTSGYLKESNLIAGDNIALTQDSEGNIVISSPRG